MYVRASPSSRHPSPPQEKLIDGFFEKNGDTRIGEYLPDLPTSGITSRKSALSYVHTVHILWMLTSDSPPPQPSAGSCASGSDFSIVKRGWGWA